MGVGMQKHEIDITWSQVSSDFWALQVAAGPLSPLHCEAQGLGLQEAAAGLPQEFTVSLRDAWGNACAWDSSAVSVQAFWLDAEPLTAWSGTGHVAISQTSALGNVTISYTTHKVCSLSVLHSASAALLRLHWDGDCLLCTQIGGRRAWLSKHEQGIWSCLAIDTCHRWLSMQGMAVQAGSLYIQVRVQGQLIATPEAVPVLPGPLSLSHSLVKGPGAGGCQAGGKCWLVLEGRDAWGNAGASWGPMGVSVGSRGGTAVITDLDEASGSLTVRPVLQSQHA